MELSELIERLTALKGPDRSLANEILLACGWKLEHERTYKGHGDFDELDWFVPPDDGDWVLEEDAPNPTASLDAALTLVPEGLWSCSIATYYRSAHVAPVDPDSMGIADPRTGRCDGAPTVALAVCIAALKARQAALSRSSQGVVSKAVAGT